MSRRFFALCLSGLLLGFVVLACLPAAFLAVHFLSVSPIERVYDRIRHDPERLKIFLRDFPKGADLHNHLSGAVYAESFLRWAAKDGLCVSLTQARILPAPCSGGKGERPASALVSDEDAQNRMIDALSMRDFAPTAEDRSGHDHFFATFARFAALENDHQGDMLAEALDHAARDHVAYLELMISPSLGDIVAAGARRPWPEAEDMEAAHRAFLPELARLVPQARRAVDHMEKRAREALQCGTAQARPGCAVERRYLFQAIRTFPPKIIFAELETGYALVKADRRFVGLNFVAPEDDPVAMRDYDRHMAMFRFLNGVYPDVPLALHAGELTSVLVPPEGLRHHIRAAIDVAGARRIGHGVDIASEDDPAALMADMARRKIPVEINLSSNDEILGVSGDAHPFRLYRRAGVPLTLSTDDEGVSRGGLTQEYLRAAQTYGLNYGALRQFSRAGLEYAFLPGESLWEDHRLGQTVSACRSAKPEEPPVGACARFLQSSEKARLQWKLEGQLHRFETAIPREVLFQ